MLLTKFITIYIYQIVNIINQLIRLSEIMFIIDYQNLFIIIIYELFIYHAVYTVGNAGEYSLIIIRKTLY